MKVSSLTLVRGWMVWSAALAVVLTLLIPAARLWADGDNKAAAPATPGKPGTPAPLDLEDHMDAMGSAFKKLQRQAKDDKLGPESASLVVEMESHIVIAKTMTPPDAQDLSGQAQADFILGYRKKLLEATGQLLQLEGALIENRTKDAADLLKTIEGTMRAGHKLYKKEKAK